VRVPVKGGTDRVTLAPPITSRLVRQMDGDITTTYNRMELAADPGLAITIYTAEPASRSAEALSLLGSWAATPGQPELKDAEQRP